MEEFWAAFAAAFELIIHFDQNLVEIVGLSVQVSLSAVIIAAFVGLPIGAGLVLMPFRGKRLAVIFLNALMGLPPVVVGLIVYLILSRGGPLGVLGLLFSPTAMIIAQVILITPLIAALTRQVVEELWREYQEQLLSMGCGRLGSIPTLLWDGRFSLMTSVLAGFGRASAEVGAVMIVGGNIDHVTRVMTTAIALEVSKGDLSLALGLGIVLLCLSIAINGAAFMLGEFSKKKIGA